MHIYIYNIVSIRVFIYVKVLGKNNFHIFGNQNSDMYIDVCIN